MATLAPASLLVWLGSPLAVMAQATPPDAGAIQRQTERSLERQNLPSLLPRATAPQIALPKPGAVAVTVRSFQFAGNRLLGTERLQTAVAPWLMRPLDFAGLRQAAEAVAAAYRDEGWIASASLRRQEIADGNVTIDIVEARFGGARIEGRSAQRVKAERLLAMVYATQATGAPLSARAIDRVLLLMDDLPGVSVEGNLVAGARDGETALALTLADEPRFGGDTALDNNGSRSVGIERISANLNWNSPTGSGDAVTLNLIHTRGSDYQRLSYSLPLGVRGLRLSAQASNIGYHVISVELAALGARGQAQTASLGLSWPIERSRLLNLNASLRQEVRRYDNEANGATSSRYRIDASNADLSGNVFDTLGGGGASSASLSLVAGRVDLSGSPNQLADAQTARTAGPYAKLGLTLTRQQAITETLSLSIAAAWQRASKNLDSSEKIYLGGSAGVRAYPASEGGGALGHTLTLELRQRLGDRWMIAGFYDTGEVTGYRQASSPSTGQPLSDAPNRVALRGAGLSASWQARTGLDFKATLARRIGTNPNPSANGHDQDGSLQLNRLWVSASLAI
jgi:hemolysin activation/secretion protein